MPHRNTKRMEKGDAERLTGLALLSSVDWGMGTQMSWSLHPFVLLAALPYMQRDPGSPSITVPPFIASCRLLVGGGWAPAWQGLQALSPVGWQAYPVPSTGMQSVSSMPLQTEVGNLVPDAAISSN